MTSRRRRFGSVGSVAVTSNAGATTSSSGGTQPAVSPRAHQFSLSTSAEPSSPELSSPTNPLRRHRRSFSTGTPNSPQSLNTSTDDDGSSWSSPQKKKGSDGNDGSVRSPEFTVGSPEGAVRSPESTVGSPEGAVPSPESTVGSPESTVATVRSPEAIIDDGSLNPRSTPASELNTTNVSNSSSSDVTGLADARRRRRRIRNLHTHIASTVPVSREGGDDEVSTGSLQTSGSAGTTSSRSHNNAVPRGTASGFMRARAFRRSAALSTKPGSKASTPKASKLATKTTPAQRPESKNEETSASVTGTVNNDSHLGSGKIISGNQALTESTMEQTVDEVEASSAPSRVLDKEARRRRRKDREDTRSKIGLIKGFHQQLSDAKMARMGKEVLTDEESCQARINRDDKPGVVMTDEERSHNVGNSAARLTTIRMALTDDEGVPKIAAGGPEVPTDEEGSAANAADFSKAARRRRRALRKARTSSPASNGKKDTDDDVSTRKDLSTRLTVKSVSSAENEVKNIGSTDSSVSSLNKPSIPLSSPQVPVSGRRGFISKSLNRQRRKQLLAERKNDVANEEKKEKPPPTSGVLSSSKKGAFEGATKGEAKSKGYDTRSILDVPPDPPTDKEDRTKLDRSSPEDDDATHEDCYVPPDELDKVKTKKRRKSKKDEEVRRSRSRSRRSNRIARLEMSVSVEPQDRRHDPFVHGLAPKQYLSEDDGDGDDIGAIRAVSSVDTDDKKVSTRANTDVLTSKRSGRRAKGNKRKNSKEDKYVSPFLSASFTEGEEGGIPASASAETTKAGAAGAATVVAALNSSDDTTPATSRVATDRADEAWDLRAQPHRWKKIGSSKSIGTSVGSSQGGGDQKNGTLPLQEEETKSETASWACFSDTTICTNNRAFGRNTALSVTRETGDDGVDTADRRKETSSDVQGGEKLVVRRWAQWAQAIQRNASDFTEEKDGDEDDDDDEEESSTEDDDDEESTDDEDYTSTEYTDEYGDETDDVDDETDEQVEERGMRDGKRYRDDVGLLRASSSQVSTDEGTDDGRAGMDHMNQIERIKRYMGAGNKAERSSSEDDEETETDGDGQADDGESDASGIAEESGGRNFKALEAPSDNDDDQGISELYSTLGCATNPITDCSDDPPEGMKRVVEQLDAKANRPVVARDQIFLTFSDYNSEDDKRVAAASVQRDVDAVLRLADMERSGARLESKDTALADLGTFDETDAGTTISRDSATIETMATNEKPAQAEPLQTAQVLSEVAVGAATMWASVLMSVNETASPKRPKPSPERPESPAHLEITSPRREKGRYAQDSSVGTGTADSPGRTSTAASSLVGTNLVESGFTHPPTDGKSGTTGFPPPSPKKATTERRLVTSPPRMPEGRTTAEQPMSRRADDLGKKTAKVPLLPPPPEEKMKKWLHSKRQHFNLGSEVRDSQQKPFVDEMKNAEVHGEERDADKESLIFSDASPMTESVASGGNENRAGPLASAVPTQQTKVENPVIEDNKKDTYTEVTEKTSDDYPDEPPDCRSTVSDASSVKGSDANKGDAGTPADMALLAALSSVKQAKQKRQENKASLLPRTPPSPSSQISPPRYVGENPTSDVERQELMVNEIGETAKLLHGGDDITEFGVGANTDRRELAKALWKRNSLTKSQLSHDAQMVSDAGPSHPMASPEKLRDLKGLSARLAARRPLSGNPSEDASPDTTAAEEAKIVSDSRVAAKMASAAKKFEERYGSTRMSSAKVEAPRLYNSTSDHRGGETGHSDQDEVFICSDAIALISSWNEAIKDKSQDSDDVCGRVMGATDCIDGVSRQEDVNLNDVEAIDLQSATGEGRGRGLDLKGGAFSSWQNLEYAAPSDGASSVCGSETKEKKEYLCDEPSKIPASTTDPLPEDVVKASLQSSWVPGDPLTEEDLYNWLLLEVLGPSCDIVVVQFLRASNTMPYERRLRYLVDNDEVVNRMCQFVADRVNKNRMYGETKDDCVSDIHSESGVSDFSFDTAADSTVLETVASNFWQKRRKLDAFVMQPQESTPVSSANVLSANFVSFLSRVSHIIDKPSPFGKENPFILDIVSSSLPGSQSPKDPETKTMQNLVFGFEPGMTTRVLRFLFEASATDTSNAGSALAGINEDGSFDVDAAGTPEMRETSDNNQEATESSSGGGNIPDGEAHGNSEEEATDPQINHNLIVPRHSPSPFEIGVWNEPSIVVIALAFLGDPVAVCRIKMINRFCNRIISENEHNIMRNAVRVGGMSMHIRPAFWMWITVEGCGRGDEMPSDSLLSGSNNTDDHRQEQAESSDNVFTALERKGREGKWRNVIQRDVSRAFGNMPPHKTGAKLRQDSIVRALVTYGRGRLIKRGVKGGGEAEPVPRIKSPGNGRYRGERRFSDGVPPWEIEGGMEDNQGDRQPETVSDWGGISPVGSTASSNAHENDGLDVSHREGGRKKSEKRRNSLKEVDELALGGNDLTFDMKADLQKKLGFILHAMAAGHEEVGYCQGMDYVVAHLLRVLQDTILWKAVRGRLPASIVSRPNEKLLEGLSESILLLQSPHDQRRSLDAISRNSHVVEEVVFRTMDTFLTTYNLRHMYWPELRCLKTCCRVFERLIQRKLPVLADHFEHHELNVGLFALGWFQTLFLYLPSMPSATVCHMWDIWLVERSFKIFFRVGTAILFLSQPILLNHELEGMMTYLNTFPDATLLNPDILIACALQIKVTNKMLVELEMEVTGEGGSS